MKTLTTHPKNLSSFLSPFIGTALIVCSGTSLASVQLVQGFNHLFNGSMPTSPPPFAGSPSQTVTVDKGAFIYVDRSTFQPWQFLVGNSVTIGTNDLFYPQPSFPQPNVDSSSATISVSGSGQVGGAAQLQANQLFVGKEKTGRLLISNQGVVQSGAGTQVAQGSAGEVSLSNGAIFNQTSGNFTVGAHNAITQPNQALLSLSSNSTLNMSASAILGIGYAGSSSVGAGRLVVNQSTVNGNVVIGSNSILNGSGTINGSVTNYGVINPGNSPGTLYINGNLIIATGGSLVLEVQSNGTGGYITDHIIVADPTQLASLSSAPITFSFLGNTDANAFFSSDYWTPDTFFGVGNASSNVALGQTVSASTIADYFDSVQYQVLSPSSAGPTALDSTTASAFYSASSNEVPLPSTGWLLAIALLALPPLSRGANWRKR